MEMIHKIGRRKTAVARVYVTEGNGNITINKRDLSNYFPTATLQYKVKQPFTLTNNEENFDVKVNVYGGGITGQAEGLLTRDPRMVERKKFGQKKARKKFQFSKR